MSGDPLVEELLALPLDGWHRAQGARMVPFAGYAMPIQYRGIVAEHEWTRSSASLFDVSHMGQLLVAGCAATAELERLLPADLAALKPGRTRYSLLLDESGGILDDLMVTRLYADGDWFQLVVNGATKAADIAWLRQHLPQSIAVTHLTERALLALQGPAAVTVLDDMLPGIDEQVAFMEATIRQWRGHELWLTRSGYTGEDGCEISLPSAAAEEFADALLRDPRVEPAGLGARDSLRLEAGLPLYGHDLTPAIDPVTAGLEFAISPRRRAEGGYPGHGRIAELLAAGSSRRRIGLALTDRLPAREGAPVFAGDVQVGNVTSGGFSPTLGHPIAMALVAAEHSAPGAALAIEVRGRMLPATVVPLPFVPHRYHRRGVR